MFKRIVAVLLCIAVLLGVSVIPASSLSYDAGIGALREQWESGEGPSVVGFNIDYSYYVPATTEPCPLFVFMGGAGNGTYEGKELNATDFPYWSSDEFQSSAVNTKGMYLMILRSPLPFYFDTCPLEPMYEAIRDFADTHNVDKKRIILIGRCLGASGAHRLAVNYPDYFSGVCYLCPRTRISMSDAKTLSHMKIWIFNSYLDSYSIFPFYALPSWINLLLFTKVRKNVRFTTCVKAPRGGGILNHEMCRLVEKNFTHDVEKDYTGLSTVDAMGKLITKPDVIQFFTSGSYTRVSSSSEDGLLID